MKARLPQGMGKGPSNNMNQMLKQAQKMQDEITALQARAGRSDSRQRGYPSGKQAQEEKNYLRAEIRLLRARGSRGDGADIISALNNSCKIRSSRRRDSSVCVRCTPPCREARSGDKNRCSF